jgi:predicted DNA-binding protein (MmcQ/YjbR family)
MTLDDYNAVCAALPHTSHVVQWGGAHVWKVAGKVFAIAGWRDGPAGADGAPDVAVTFKVTPIAYELLKDAPGLRPAPYLASRGMTWIQRVSGESLDDAALAARIADSHRLVAAGLPRKTRRQLGLEPS